MLEEPLKFVIVEAEPPYEEGNQRGNKGPGLPWHWLLVRCGDEHVIKRSNWDFDSRGAAVEDARAWRNRSDSREVRLARIDPGKRPSSDFAWQFE